MKKIFFAFITCLSVLISRSQTGTFSTINVGTNTPIVIGDGTITPSGTGDASRALEIHSTKLNVGPVNSYTYSALNTAFFNCSTSGDGTEMVRFRTNSNTSYLSFTQQSNMKLRALLMQAGSPQLYISENGNIGIGNSSPNTNAKLDITGTTYTNKLFVGVADANTNTYIGSSNLLAVNGTAVFVKAKVALYGTAWPDYVFTKEYKLPKLDTLENFIRANKHLPEIPSAEEIAKNGIDLGDNQALLLKKIEELTLIVINLSKKQKELEKKINKKAFKTRGNKK